MLKQTSTIDKAALEIVKAASVPPLYFTEQVLLLIENLGDGINLLIQSVRYSISCRSVWRDAIEQIAVVGVNSLLLVMITVAFSGLVLSLYSTLFLTKFGAGSYVGGSLGLSIVREIAPVLTAVVVTARSGSAIAAEIGSMKVTEQIDALRSLAISPIQFLVAPRVVACFIVFPILTIFGNVMGLTGGYLIAVAKGLPGSVYTGSAARMVDGYDISMGLIKGAVFGLVVALVCCQQGLRTRGGATGVGRSTTNAVVISIVLIYILNFFLAYLMFGNA